jgi:hypothetical protein
MNIVGKILVILNLLLALVVGGFLVIDFATRTNWKTYSDSQKRELDVARVNVQTLHKSLQDSDNQVKKAKAEADGIKGQIADLEAQHKAELVGWQAKVQDEERKAKEQTLVSQKALLEAERLKEESKALNATIQERNKKITDMLREVAEAKQFAMANERQYIAMKGRVDALLAQITDLTGQLRDRDAKGPGLPGKGNGRDATALNPPPNFVKGKVEKVDPDNKSRVQLDLGTDDGVNKGHTLVIYRLGKQPEYLGYVQIVEANHHKSLGQLLPNALGTRPVLQKGDIVASAIR